jgi:hypothetical protein
MFSRQAFSQEYASEGCPIIAGVSMSSVSYRLLRPRGTELGGEEAGLGFGVTVNVKFKYQI